MNACRFGAGTELPSKGKIPAASDRSAWCRTPPPRPGSGDRDSSPSEPGTGAFISPPPSQQFNSLTLGKLLRLEPWWRRRQASRTASVEASTDEIYVGRDGQPLSSVGSPAPAHGQRVFPLVFSLCSDGVRRTWSPERNQGGLPRPSRQRSSRSCGKDGASHRGLQVPRKEGPTAVRGGLPYPYLYGCGLCYAEQGRHLL